MAMLRIEEQLGGLGEIKLALVFADSVEYIVSSPCNRDYTLLLSPPERAFPHVTTRPSASLAANA